jgi:Flp pilus assembly protein TadG
MNTLPLRGRRTRPRGHRSGQALVEFVLVMPILFLLIFGLIDFARAWQTHHAIADAAREGVRMVVVSEGAPAAKFVAAENAVAVRLAAARLDGTRVKIEWDPDEDDPPAVRGDPQQLTIRYEYRFWLLGVFMGSRSVDLVSTIIMRTE